LELQNDPLGRMPPSSSVWCPRDSAPLAKSE
jgi:hypothetical protein